jgi:hypothetical protein
MRVHHLVRNDRPRLRVVFGATSRAFGLPVGSTLGDVALWAGDIARRHNGALRSIDIKMTARKVAPPFAGTH